MTAENFGEKLREFRKENYLTQKQMAELIGLSPNHIGTLENGKKKPRASTIAAFEELVRKRSWKQPGATDIMDEDEMAIYTRIWRGLMSLEPEREKEVLQMFAQILEWL